MSSRVLAYLSPAFASPGAVDVQGGDELLGLLVGLQDQAQAAGAADGDLEGRNEGSSAG